MDPKALWIQGQGSKVLAASCPEEAGPAEEVSGAGLKLSLSALRQQAQGPARPQEHSCLRSSRLGPRERRALPRRRGWNPQVFTGPAQLQPPALRHARERWTPACEEALPSSAFHRAFKALLSCSRGGQRPDRKARLGLSPRSPRSRPVAVMPGRGRLHRGPLCPRWPPAPPRGCRTSRPAGYSSSGWHPAASQAPTSNVWGNAVALPPFVTVVIVCSHFTGATCCASSF